MELQELLLLLLGVLDMSLLTIELYCVKFARSHRLTSLWLNKPSDRSK
uniref:Uncharacterized protein n=1 Tax=Musa acuminata subsp. malaccensis TaxID=214687 RepID=A0A804KRG1_MUSAM